MSAFFLAFLVTASIMLAGREQVRAARLSAARGDRAAVFIAGMVAVIVSTAFAAWAGMQVAALMNTGGRRMFVAFALGFAAFEVALLRAPPAPVEPTRSRGALALVLLGATLTDAARFGVLALSAATGQAVLVAAGGICASIAALAVAVAAGKSWEERVRVRTLALAVAALLLLASVAIASWARLTGM